MSFGANLLSISYQVVFLLLLNGLFEVIGSSLVYALLKF